jgi:hypothetical protein
MLRELTPDSTGTQCAMARLEKPIGRHPTDPQEPVASGGYAVVHLAVMRPAIARTDG